MLYNTFLDLRQIRQTKWQGKRDAKNGMRQNDIKKASQAAYTGQGTPESIYRLLFHRSLFKCSDKKVVELLHRGNQHALIWRVR